MHRAGRGGGEVVEDEVAVGGAVDRVVADVLEAEVVGDRVAVDLPVDAGQRAGAERHHQALSSANWKRSTSRASIQK